MWLLLRDEEEGISKDKKNVSLETRLHQRQREHPREECFFQYISDE